MGLRFALGTSSWCVLLHVVLWCCATYLSRLRLPPKAGRLTPVDSRAMVAVSKPFSCQFRRPGVRAGATPQHCVHLCSIADESHVCPCGERTSSCMTCPLIEHRKHFGAVPPTSPPIPSPTKRLIPPLPLNPLLPLTKARATATAFTPYVSFVASLPTRRCTGWW